MLRFTIVTSFASILCPTSPVQGLDTYGGPVSFVASRWAVAAPEENLPDTFEAAKELFRIDRSTGKIEVVDHPELYSGPASQKPVFVAAVFGTTAGGKSASCRFLSCAIGRPTAFPSSFDNGQGRKPTRGLWSSPFVEMADGTTFLLIDMEGFDNAEQDLHVRSAVLKLLALLSEVTSVFVQVRNTQTHQTSDMEAVAKIVDSVRTTLLLKPPTKAGDDAPVGPDENFPALLVARIHQAHISLERASEIRDELAAEAQGKNYDIMKSINRNYIEVAPPNASKGLPEGVHFDYLPIKRMPSGKFFQKMIDKETSPKELWKKVSEVQDYNAQDEEAQDYQDDRFVGQSYLRGITNLRDRIVALGKHRLDGQKQKITGERLKQLLTVGVNEMNKRGPINSVNMWNQIAIDNCEKLITQEVERVVKEVIAPVDATSLSAALTKGRQQVDRFIEETSTSEDAVNEECALLEDQIWKRETEQYRLQANAAEVAAKTEHKVSAKYEAKLKMLQLLQEQQKSHWEAEKTRWESEKTSWEAQLSQKEERETSLQAELQKAKSKNQELKSDLQWKELEAKLPYLAVILGSTALILAYVSKLCPCFCPSQSQGTAAPPPPVPAGQVTEMTSIMQEAMTKQQQRMDEALRVTHQRIELLATAHQPVTPQVAVGGVGVASSVPVAATPAAAAVPAPTGAGSGNV